MMLVDCRIKPVRDLEKLSGSRYRKERWALQRQYESGKRTMIVSNEFDYKEDAERAYRKCRKEIDDREKNVTVVNNLIDELVEALMKGGETTEIYMELDYYGVTRKEVIERLKR